MLLEFWKLIKVFVLFWPEKGLWQGLNRFFTCFFYCRGTCKGACGMKKQDDHSVQDILNQMAGRMDALLDAQERTQKTRETGDIPEELRFWIAVDPLLGDLHKQFIDARASHMRLSRIRGADDPMADVANDMVDSAQCAFETRLIELRQDEDSKAMVLALMRRAHAMREEMLNEEAQERSARFWKDFARPKHRHPAVQKGASSFFMLMATLLVVRQALDQANRDLSIAAIFSRATGNENGDGWNRRRYAGA